MRKARIRKDEIESATRKKGFGSLEKVKAIIFETDGSFSVIENSKSGEYSSYESLVERRKVWTHKSISSRFQNSFFIVQFGQLQNENSMSG